MNRTLVNRTLVVCALVAAMSGLTLPAQLHAAEIALRGASSCTLWAKGRAQNDAKYEKAWLSGYFSGLALALDIDFWGTKGEDVLDNEKVWKWVDAYCAANAQNSLVQAAEKLFLERMHRTKK
jgi:hypothetical protein